MQNSWPPKAADHILKRRAELYRQIREFMEKRGVLEVDTPILSRYGNSDPYLDSFRVYAAQQPARQYYLHTSPELCMKRLLAAGSGSIYQLSHVFRAESPGRRHLSEFTMLEWYRVGLDYYQLMDEVIAFVIALGLDRPDTLTYAEAFQAALGIDPHTVAPETLRQLAIEQGWGTANADRHALLDFLFSAVVMAQPDHKKPLIIYDYPECMAALATLKERRPAVSERFELFLNGMEIANGFNELTDVDEQKKRFAAELKQRCENNLHQPPLDTHFLNALKRGLPKSAGVAFGLDRLMMVLTGKDDIREVCAFTLDNN